MLSWNSVWIAYIYLQKGNHLPRVTLALFTANLNSKICHTVLSAHEIWTQ